MFRGKLCNQKDDIAVGSLFSLVLENVAHLMVNFEQAVSIDPQESHMWIYSFFLLLHGVVELQVLLQHLNNMHVN
jgi:hypothetical protein